MYVQYMMYHLLIDLTRIYSHIIQLIVDIIRLNNPSCKC